MRRTQQLVRPDKFYAGKIDVTVMALKRNVYFVGERESWRRLVRTLAAKWIS